MFFKMKHENLRMCEKMWCWTDQWQSLNVKFECFNSKSAVRWSDDSHS